MVTITCYCKAEHLVWIIEYALTFNRLAMNECKTTTEKPGSDYRLELAFASNENCDAFYRTAQNFRKLI